MSDEIGLHKQYEHSDKYRGYEFEKVKTPPIKEIKIRLKNAEENLKIHEKQIEKYKKLIKKLELLEKKEH